MKRRDILTAAFALPTIAAPMVTASVLAEALPPRSSLSFDAQALEIADMLRAHFRETLPEGCERYALSVWGYRDPTILCDSGDMCGRAVGKYWFPGSDGWA